MSKKHRGKDIDDKTFRTPPFRIAWQELFEPNEKGQRTIKMVFDDNTTDYSLIEEKLAEAAKPLGGLKKIPEDKRCLRATPDVQQERYGEDTRIASATTTFGVTVVDASRNPVMDDTGIVLGSYAVAVVESANYDFKDPGGMRHRGVKLYLKAVQLLGGGKRFAGSSGIDVNNVFDEQEDRGATVDSEDGWDD